MFSSGDVPAVRRPGRAVEQAKSLFCDLPGVGPVAVYDPDIVSAAAIAGECYVATVGAVPGLHVPGNAGGQAYGQPKGADAAAIKIPAGRKPGR